MKPSFFARTNDLACRSWSARAARFARAKLRRWCGAGMMFADDPRSLRAWRRGWDVAHFIQLLRWKEEGFQPRVIYDIGAHEGLWSEMCQAIFAPAECFLFEPQSELGQRAMSRQPKEGPAWQLLPVALGDEEGTLVLHVTRNPAASSLLPPLADASAGIVGLQPAREEKVPVVPLDALVVSKGLSKPDLVKIDVQGFEARVLAGGRATVGAARRVVLETSLQPLYSGQSLMPEVLKILSDWGFALDDLQEAFRQWPGPLRQVDLWLRRK